MLSEQLVHQILDSIASSIPPLAGISYKHWLHSYSSISSHGKDAAEAPMSSRRSVFP